jgi:hypothetical protein
MFSLAEWQTNLTVVPLDRSIFDSGYFDGVEVQGFNRHLVETVAAALSDLSPNKVRIRVQTLTVERTNPKWAWCEQSIRVTLGHANAD